jgi:TatD DNase family protein
MARSGNGTNPQEMLTYIDTHAHIYHNRFRDDIADVIARAQSAGVDRIIVPATEPEDYRPMYDLVSEYPMVEIALGVHPHSAAKVDDAAIEELPALAANRNAIAIGEIGLDYYYDHAPRDRQQEVFRRQLEIARELGLPAVIHNRESDEDVLTILEEFQDGSLRFQLHCFSSDVDILKRALDLGAVVSFTGNVTFKKSTLDPVLVEVPDDRFMVETDSPYMTPEPNRGKRNEPSYVPYVVEKIAAIRNQTVEKVAEMTTRTARSFFRLPLAVMLLGMMSVMAAAGQVISEDPIDTTESVRGPYDKLIGIGPHVTSTTFLVERTTSASATALGPWITFSPLQPLGLNRWQIDLQYTPSRVDDRPNPAVDSALINKYGDTVVTNVHNTFNAFLRFNANPRSFITFHLSLGYTLFHNSYGINKLILEGLNDTAVVDSYDETKSGLGGGFGLTANIETNYGTIAPIAQVHFSAILGDRRITNRGGSFAVSQVRLGLLFYPNISKTLGLTVPE